MTSQSYYEKNREDVKAKAKLYRESHRDYYRAKVRERHRVNPRTAADRAEEKERWRWKRGVHDSHVRLYKKQPKPAEPVFLRPEIHDAHVRVLRESKTLMYRWRYANDPDFMVKERLRRQLRKKLLAVPNIAELLRKAVKEDRQSSTVEAALGYTVAEFRRHLEKQFVSGMSWDGMSRSGWHIDHILPKRCFDVSTKEGLRAYYSLTNLRPLAASENLRKGAAREFLL